ncbi:hypothetical protein O181_087257 [Austropuccinia psidii MF-1]|uniref:Uncharacterized protein n=1 Tax=Austropuccinia psidii MF-1 TaxID=1389203 RepID=A0A9Q3IPB4_9BASI|nr:hypothetical protein [Austropuccinia psidii MF-1]
MEEAQAKKGQLKDYKSFKEVDEKTYEMLLQFLRKKNPNLKDYQNGKNARPEEVLRNYMKEKKEIVWKMDIKLSAKTPNEIIQFKTSKGFQIGRIAHILDLEREELHRGPIILVEDLIPVQQQNSTYNILDAFVLPWDVHHLTISHFLHFVSTSDVFGLCAYVNLPAWTLGCPRTSILVNPVNKLLALEQQFL